MFQCICVKIWDGRFPPLGDLTHLCVTYLIWVISVKSLDWLIIKNRRFGFLNWHWQALEFRIDASQGWPMLEKMSARYPQGLLAGQCKPLLVLPVLVICPPLHARRCDIIIKQLFFRGQVMINLPLIHCTESICYWLKMCKCLGQDRWLASGEDWKYEQL